VTDAVGIRLHELPMSPDRVLKAIEAKERRAALRQAKDAARPKEPAR
jgi:hypothetical protein